MELSYRETLDIASRIASQLFSLGAQPGDRVLVMATNSADCLLAGMSCIISGLVEVPINTEYKGAILEHQVQVVKPRFGIIDSEFAELFAKRSGFESIEHFLVIGTTGPSPGSATAGRRRMAVFAVRSGEGGSA